MVIVISIQSKIVLHTQIVTNRITKGLQEPFNPLQVLPLCVELQQSQVERAEEKLKEVVDASNINLKLLNKMEIFHQENIVTKKNLTVNEKINFKNIVEVECMQEGSIIYLNITILVREDNISKWIKIENAIQLKNKLFITKGGYSMIVSGLWLRSFEQKSILVKPHEDLRITNFKYMESTIDNKYLEKTAPIDEWLKSKILK